MILLISTAYCYECASELQDADGTCINKTYTMLFGGGESYYACSTVTKNLWYYENCTATVSTTTLRTNKGNIVAEWYSNEPNKVSACAGRDGYLCNVNPLYGFKTDTSLSYVGYCDSSEQTCVKCSIYNTEIKKFDGTGTIKTSISGAGNNLCESGCTASIQCDEKPQGYNVGNAGCNNYCKWQECNNYKFNIINNENECFTSCDSNNECFEPAVCDLIINPNTCKVDNNKPVYHEYFHTDLTPTPDNSIIKNDLILLSAYWTDNLYLNHSELLIRNNGEWIVYDRIDYINSNASWTNYTINTSDLLGLVEWTIKATDIASNTEQTPTLSFIVYEKSAEFNITLNLNDESKLIQFIAWGSIEENKKPDNAINSINVGEITLTHNGRGIDSKYSFKIGENEIPSTIRIKLTNTPTPDENALELSNEYQNPLWCQNQIRNDECQIWVWMDADYGNIPAEYLQNLVVKHESN